MYDVTQLLESIRRRRRLALALFIIFSIIGAIAVMLMPRTYATSSEVLVKRPDTTLQSTTYPQIDALLAWNRNTAMETYVALARQPAVAGRVIRTLGLKATVKDLLARNVVVTPLTNSDIINIQVDWHDARGSALVANAFARVFIDQQRALAASQAAEAAASLSVALKKAQSDLVAAQRALTLFESRNQLADAPTQTTAILSAISDVQSKERALDAERVQAQGQLSRIGTELAALPGTIDASNVISGSPVADQIEQQLSQQQLNLRLLRRQYTARYPDVVAAENQIATLRSQLRRVPPTKVTSRNVEPNPLAAALASQAATLRAQTVGNSAQLTLLRSQEASLLDQLRVFPAGVSELSTLQRREKAAEAIYVALQNNYFNAIVARSMAVTDLSIVQYADPALATVRPARLISLLAVILVAALITLAIVALLEWSVPQSMSLGEVR
jgi:succinoglycan biosynthesis transport protein ExoP